MLTPNQFLTIEKLTVRFGGILALDNVSFTMKPNEILGLMGPNGSGKTTLFNCLSRIYTPESGDIIFQEQSLLKLYPHTVIQQGISRTFQNLALFKSMSAIDNVLVGAHSTSKAHFLSDFFGLKKARNDQERRRVEALEILRLLDLENIANRCVSDLPFAIQKRVELARALISKPKLLLLDEPANGLNHLMVDELKQAIRRIKTEQGIAILIVEHNMKLVMDVSERVVVLDFGKKIAEGIPESIRKNPDVINAYLGNKPV